MLIKVNIYGQNWVCVAVPFQNNPSPPEDFDPTGDIDISGQGLMGYARSQLFFNCTVSALLDFFQHL